MMRHIVLDSSVSYRLAWFCFTAILSLGVLSGCASIGPPTVDRDRFEYVSAISASWKRQTLLNLVKTRYLDVPVFMDVASVISQYALEGELEAGFRWDAANSQTLGGIAKYTDRPTISYSPMTGQNFASNILRPMPVSTILLLIQAGCPVDWILRICVQGINGLDNRADSVLVQRIDPEFNELLGLLRRIQLMDGIRMRARSSEAGQKLMLYFTSPETTSHALDLKKALHLLGLSPDAREFSVVSGFLADNDREVAIMSRSMLQIMTNYASYIDVPDSDISEGRVLDVKRGEFHTESQLQPLIQVRCRASKPDDAYICVPYRNHWFYIDDRDILSKRTFFFLMIMFSFTEKGETNTMAPVLTVPTN